MTRLYLLRHARARWAEPGARDYDRALDPSGHEDAARLAAAMAAAGYVPDTVLCSGARRARETWADVSTALPVADVRFVDQLYSADASGYLDLVRAAGTAGSLLLVGHNPMMEDLATALSRAGEEKALAAVAAGFPTCGLAVLRFASPLGEIEPDGGYLEAFLRTGE
jgi:phosphohistidine phosphatase